VAGFGDGSVKVFDRRLDEEDAVVRSYSEHTSWVQNARWHPKVNGQIVSARSVLKITVVSSSSDSVFSVWMEK
jgi:regulator-associated protein of mTOR